jgi:hypothetical protein
MSDEPAKELSMKSDPETGHPLNHEKVGLQVTARRRLLRGTFAAPSVLALSSGSALAASSSLRCFNNAPAGVNNPPANYFTVQRYISTGQKVVKASDITNLGILKGFSTSAYVGTKTWIKVTDGSEFTPSGEPALNPGVLVALRLSNVGTDAAPVFSVTGLALDATVVSGAGNVMTTSCWSSFRP